jgi:hypothetical protein
MKKATAAVVDLPPGEDGVELTSGDAIAALHDALVTVTKPADKRLTVRHFDVTRVGRWTLLECRLKDGKQVIEFTVRMPRARAQSLRQLLNRVLD